MEDNYYTPEMSEFHVGFEYEVFHEGKWKKTCVPENRLGADFIFEIKDMGHWNVVQKPRVKYLDREDIESLGWKYGGDDLEFDSINYYNDKGYELQEWGHMEYSIERYPHHKTELKTIHLVGIIKNKSELKVLMKQIGII